MNCSVPLIARLEFMYWLMAACVVLSFFAVSTCVKWYVLTSSLATRDRKTGSTYFPMVSHLALILFDKYNAIILNKLDAS